MTYEIQMIVLDSLIGKFRHIVNRTLKNRGLDKVIQINLFPYGVQGESDSASNYGGEFTVFGRTSPETIMNCPLYGPNEKRLTSCLELACDKIDDDLASRIQAA